MYRPNKKPGWWMNLRGESSVVVCVAYPLYAPSQPANPCKTNQPTNPPPSQRKYDPHLLSPVECVLPDSGSHVGWDSSELTRSSTHPITNDEPTSRAPLRLSSTCFHLGRLIPTFLIFSPIFLLSWSKRQTLIDSLFSCFFAHPRSS